jgi:hypothetical protein
MASSLNVGDWGWLIGGCLGAALYLVAARLFSERMVGAPVPVASGP